MLGRGANAVHSEGLCVSTVCVCGSLNPGYASSLRTSALIGMGIFKGFLRSCTQCLKSICVALFFPAYQTFISILSSQEPQILLQSSYLKQNFENPRFTRIKTKSKILHNKILFSAFILAIYIHLILTLYLDQSKSNLLEFVSLSIIFYMIDISISIIAF